MYDLKELKAIPLSDVAMRLGIQLSPKGQRMWGKLRPDERTNSFSINLEKNLWYDFGISKGGSAIDLVVMCHDIPKEEAINVLADMFGIKPLSYEGVRTLTDTQYRDLGIHPEKATYNFKAPSSTQGNGQFERWKNKYDMSVQALANTYPSVYDKLLKSVGVKSIEDMIVQYKESLEVYRQTLMDKNPAYDKPFTLKLLSVTLEMHSSSINKCVSLLESALIQSEKFNYLKVNHHKDIKTLEEKEVIERNEIMSNKVVKAYLKLGFNEVANFSLEQVKALCEFNSFCVKNAPNAFLSPDKFEGILNLIKENIVNMPTNDTASFFKLNSIIVYGETLVDAVKEHSPNQRLPSKANLHELEMES